jgi:hypothetical protein
MIQGQESATCSMIRFILSFLICSNFSNKKRQKSKSKFCNFVFPFIGQYFSIKWKEKN